MVFQYYTYLIYIQFISGTRGDWNNCGFVLINFQNILLPHQIGLLVLNKIEKGPSLRSQNVFETIGNKTKWIFKNHTGFD